MQQIESFATKIIRQKARQLIGKYGFSRSDREDLEQDLWLDLIRRWEKHGENVKDPKAFVVTIVDRQIATLIEQRQSKKHSDEDLRSLHTLVPDEDGRLVPFSEVLPSAQAQARNQTDTLSDLASCDLRLDVAEVVRHLPSDLRKVCRLLQGQSQASAARTLKITRGAMRKAVRSIQGRFLSAGLDASPGNSEPMRPDFRSEELIEDQFFERQLKRATTTAGDCSSGERKESA